MEKLAILKKQHFNSSLVNNLVCQILKVSVSVI